MSLNIDQTLIGVPPLDQWDATADARFPLGQVIESYDPYFGFGRFIYVKIVSQALLAGRLMQWDDAFLAIDNPNTGNTGRPVGVLKSRTASNASGVYGWLQTHGLAPVQAGTFAAAGAVFFNAAGAVQAAAAAGKQILSAYAVAGTAKTFTKTVQTKNGSPRVIVPSLDGLFPGLPFTGTGMTGTIQSLESGSQNAVIMSANATATGQITATALYTGYAFVQLMAPCVQGQIT